MVNIFNLGGLKKSNPEDAKTYFEQGLVAGNKGDFENAINNFTKAVSVDPANAKAYLYRGYTWARLTDYDQAISDYTRAVEIDPSKALGYFNRAVSYHAIWEFKKAISDYTRALKIQPRDARYYVYRGTAYYDIFQVCLGMAYESKGDGFGENGEYDRLAQSIGDYTRAIEIDPNYSKAYFCRGNAHNFSGSAPELFLNDYARSKELSEVYGIEIASDPVDIPSKYMGKSEIGAITQKVLDEIDRWAGGNEHPKVLPSGGHVKGYLETIEPLHEVAKIIVQKEKVELYNKGVTLFFSGKHKEAIEYFDKAIEVDPNFIHAWSNKGRSLSELGNHEAALECCEKVVELDPQFEFAFHNKGCELCQIGRYEEAIEYFDKAFEFHPNKEEVWDAKGLSLSQLGRHEEAIECFNKAIELEPNKEEAWHNKVISLDRLGKREEAAVCLSQAREFNPNFLQ